VRKRARACWSGSRPGLVFVASLAR
jgi:hypothetical protein